MVKKTLKEIKGVGPSMVKKLETAGIHTLEDLASQSPEKLCEIDGIGAKTAENWISEANQLLEKDQARTREEARARSRGQNQVQARKKQEGKSESETESENLGFSQALMDAMDSMLEKLETDIERIFERIAHIEQRVEELETRKAVRPMEGKKLIPSMMTNPFIRTDDMLLDVMKEKIKELKTHSPSLQNIFIADLYRQIIKDYSITREIFLEYLLMLYRGGKIQLEPGRTDQGFFVRDAEGNAYKIVKIIE